MSNGWLVLTTKERQVLHSREAILPDPVGDQVHLQLEEAEAGSKPPRRLHGKQPMPGHQPMRVPLPEMPRDDRGGESSLVQRVVKKELNVCVKTQKGKRMSLTDVLKN